MSLLINKTAAGTVVTVAKAVVGGQYDVSSDVGSYCPRVMLGLLLLWLLLSNPIKSGGLG